MAINIKSFFDECTATFTYVIYDPTTMKAAVIDSVLNYDQYTGRSSTKSADEIISYLSEQKLQLEFILETHIHADHLSAAHYLKEKVGGKIGISSHIKEVLAYWVPIFNTEQDTSLDAYQFDVLFNDNQLVKLGNLAIKIIHTPGHTPACASYLIEDAIFVGDTIFMPDVGTARTDFPGASSAIMYDSIMRILSLPDDTRIFTCHDYPPPERQAACSSTVKEQQEKNIMLNKNISKSEYIAARNKRNEGKSIPEMLLCAIQVNLRAGSFGHSENNGVKYIKIPINKI